MSINKQTIVNMTDSTQRDSLVDEDVLVYLKCICAAAGTILNIATLVACAYIGHNMRPYVWNFVSLTVTDLIMSTVILIHGLLKELNTANTPLVNCLKFGFKSFESASILTCLFMLLLIAINQCVSTSFPLKYKRVITRKLALFSIVSVWIFTFSATFAVIVWNTLDEGGVNSHKNVNTCFNIHREYTLYINTILITVSCPVFIGFYIVIHKNIRALKQRDSIRGRRTSMKKATTTTLLLVVPFVLVYVPMSIYILVMTAFKLRVTWPFWEFYMVVLSGHTIWNPICYATRVKEIQDGYKRLCQNCKHIN